MSVTGHVHRLILMKFGIFRTYLRTFYNIFFFITQNLWVDYFYKILLNNFSLYGPETKRIGRYISKNAGSTAIGYGGVMKR